jgi:hypothetical protein
VLTLQLRKAPGKKWKMDENNSLSTAALSLFSRMRTRENRGEDEVFFFLPSSCLQSLAEP